MINHTNCTCWVVCGIPLALHLHFAGWCIMPATHGCRATCSAAWHVDVCVQGTGTAVADPCVCYACLLKVIWRCRDGMHLPSLGKVRCLCVCLCFHVVVKVWLCECNVGFIIPCLMSWQSVILKIKRHCMIHQNIPVRQLTTEWVCLTTVSISAMRPLDCCILEMNELHSCASTETSCIASFPWKHYEVPCTGVVVSFLMQCIDWCVDLFRCI